MPKMRDDTLRALISAEIKAAAGGDDSSKLAKDRLRAMRYYRGDEFGNEVDGRSSVVSRDVAEAIDQTMPALMEIFETTNEICRFEPRILYGMPADEISRRCAHASDATEHVNAIWRQADEGYLTTYAWLHDALRFRNGVIKIWWDETPHVTRERYEGLSDLSAQMLASDETVEVVETVSRPDPTAAAAMMVGEMMGSAPPPGPDGKPPEPPEPPMVHDIVVARTNMRGRVKVSPVPLDEFLIQGHSSQIACNPFTAHRYMQAAGELAERFPEKKDEIMDLPAASEDTGTERSERFVETDDQITDSEEFDPTRRRVWVCEAFVKVDYDGDGVAEMRSVITAGSEDGGPLILQNEEVDDNPFATITPYPEPHAFWGSSVSDKTEDIQLIKSTLMRGALDNTYLANCPTLMVNEQGGRVNFDDLLVRKIGGIVRTSGPPAENVVPLPVERVAPDAYQMIAMMDAVREQRTGLRRFAQGPGADVLNNAYTDTATGAMMVDDSSKERVRFIARNCAETGFKRAMRIILKLESMHNSSPLMVPRGTDYAPVDPREWDTEMGMAVTVGLGTGSQQKLGQVMMGLLNIDAQIIAQQKGLDGPLLKAEHVYAKLEKLIEYAGLKSASPYYMDPKGQPMQGQQKQQQPDPALMKAQAQIAIAQQKAQTDAQLQQTKLQADMVAERVKAEFDMALARAKAQNDMQIEQLRASNQAEIDRLRADYEAQNDARDAELRGRRELVEAMGRLSREAPNGGRRHE